jgi:hypothetical protein
LFNAWIELKHSDGGYYCAIESIREADSIFENIFKVQFATYDESWVTDMGCSQASILLSGNSEITAS